MDRAESCKSQFSSCNNHINSNSNFRDLHINSNNDLFESLKINQLQINSFNSNSNGKTNIQNLSAKSFQNQKSKGDVSNQQCYVSITNTSMKQKTVERKSKKKSNFFCPKPPTIQNPTQIRSSETSITIGTISANKKGTASKNLFNFI